MRRWTTAEGVLLLAAEYGEERVVGDRVRLRILAPHDPAGVRRLSGSLPNNASLVVLAEVSGVRVLLTGDVEPDAQRLLLYRDRRPAHRRAQGAAPRVRTPGPGPGPRSASAHRAGARRDVGTRADTRRPPPPRCWPRPGPWCRGPTGTGASR
ncbi:hypothetical protein ACU686_17830 [Yinghuangia aomiensis]